MAVQPLHSAAAGHQPEICRLLLAAGADVNARQAGGGPNPARQISIRSGVPQEVPAYTVNKACASGIKSIALGFQEIATANLDCVLAGAQWPQWPAAQLGR